MPADALAVLAQIETSCESWLRWCAAAAPADAADATGSKSVIPDGLPPAILGKVRAASAAVADLHRAVTDELVARRPGRAVRHRYRSAGE